MRYGLLDCGLAEKRRLNVIAIDISPNCNAVYEFNFNEQSGEGPLAKNLASITATELDALGPFDLVTISCPCQPFTRQHSNQQFAEQDARAESFTHLVTSVFPFLAVQPKYFLIENVKNFEQSKASERVLAMFDALGYKYRQFLLQPFQFGIPNSRLRCVRNLLPLVIDYLPSNRVSPFSGTTVWRRRASSVFQTRKPLPQNTRLGCPADRARAAWRSTSAAIYPSRTEVFTSIKLASNSKRSKIFCATTTIRPSMS